MEFEQPAFHEALKASTGIQKIEHEEQEYPQYVKDAIESQVKYYEELAPFILNPDNITKTK